MKRILALFETRPIWQKSALDEQLFDLVDEIPAWKQVEAIRMISFHAVDGPWRNTHIRFGYDPRRHPEARRWQSIDFRDPFLRDSQTNIVTQKGGLLDCHFRVAPVNRSQMFQLCDVEDSVVQAMLRMLPAASTCNEKSGWFEETDLEKFRNQLKVRSELLRK